MKLRFTSNEKAAEYVVNGLWKNQTFFQIFFEIADRLPDKVAAIDKGERYTYSQIKTTVNTIAGNLHQFGIKMGDIIAVQLPNSVYMPIIHLALNRIGAIYLPLHDGWGEAETSRLLGRSKARNNYRDIDYPAALAALQPQLPDLEMVYSMAGTGHGSKPFEYLLKYLRLITRYWMG